MKSTRRILATFATVLMACATAYASSDDAWEEFRVEVEEACLAAADGYLQTPVTVVDPFGSESFGLAVLTGLEPGGDGKPRSIVCVFDKVSKKVELGSALELAGGGS
jgi:hypothetical protein